MVTAFDEHYFRQGLNLVASIHRTSLDVVDALLVYDVGLTPAQRTHLDALERVAVVDFPAVTHGFYAAYLHPKSHAYKCAAIKFAAEHVQPGGAVLWMDAGIAALHSVEEIFRIIETEDIFFVNHDDTGFWPFYNLMFTHPRSLARMEATNRERMGLHLCSCILGYKGHGRFQPLIEEAYVYSQTEEIVVWPKHRGAADDVLPQLDPAEWLLRQALERAPRLARLVSAERLHTLFGYYGHNGDQPIYSLLAARYGCPQHSARRYNRSNALSHDASKKNWHSGRESAELVRSRYHLDEVTDGVVILHHRGTYDNLDGLRLQRRAPVALVMGPNADPPAARAEADVFGLDEGFERWAATGRYPTYYCCLDEAVLAHHAEAIARLATNAERHGLRLLLLRRSILAAQPALAAHPAVLFWEDYRPNTSLLQGGPVASAPFAVRLALALGYRDVRGVGLRRAEEAAAWAPLRDLLDGFPARVLVDDDAFAASAASYEAERTFWRDRIRADGFPRHSYPRACGVRFDEPVLMRALLEATVPTPGTMVDVGAHRGGSLRGLAQAGWRVLAFEPDPSNRERLLRNAAAFPEVTVDPRAVGEVVAEARPFYTLADSTGASSLLPFTDAHVPGGAVPVTTLRQALPEHQVADVHYLKIDAEGYDLMVLRGFPWDRMRPAAILCEFEDRKTQHLGYTYHDVAALLLEQGYTLFVSEWHPVLRYGTPHDWHAFKRYPCVLDHPDAWGNLIALREPPDRDVLNQALAAALTLPPPSGSRLRRVARRVKRRLLSR